MEGNSTIHERIVSNGNRILLALVLLLCWGCTANHSPIERYDKQLSGLDSLIALRPHFKQEREEKIVEAKVRLHKLDTLSPSRFQVNEELQALYKGYICDSLLHYIYENIQLAHRLHDTYRETESQLTLAIALAKSGMYLEGMLLLNSIDRNLLKDDQLDSYYYAYHVIYREKSYITKDNVISQQVLAPKARVYRDSLLAVIDSRSPYYYEIMLAKYTQEGQLNEALELCLNKLDTLPAKSPDIALVWYNIADLKNQMGDKQGFFEGILRSAREDMSRSIKDHASLHRVARTLYEWGEVSHAANYIQVCMEDAYFYNANVRSLQIAKTLPVVTNAYEIQNQTHINNLHLRTNIIISLLVLCICIIIMVVVQKNKLSRMHRSLKESNDSLNILSKKLSETNTHLSDVNNQLLENNYIKENYIAHFIQLNSDYINKNDKFRLEINKLLRKGKVEEAIRMTLYTGANESDLEEFYANFDHAFLSIFPYFIEEYNKLMPEDSKVLTGEKKGNARTLTSELRVFALVRLGFNDSATIAQMLRYSINTIYNIRSKAKSKAIVPKDSFERLIMKIGVLSGDNE